LLVGPAEGVEVDDVVDVQVEPGHDVEVVADHRPAHGDGPVDLDVIDVYQWPFLADRTP